jgi:hypothetical protein
MEDTNYEKKPAITTYRWWEMVMAMAGSVKQWYPSSEWHSITQASIFILAYTIFRCVNQLYVKVMVIFRQNTTL